MIWAGSPFAQLIEFSTGLPTGAISYQLIGNDGSELLSGSVAPAAGAVSHLLVIDGAYHTVATALVERRTLTWSYTTATGVVSDRISYRVEKPIPFGVSNAGVRNKIGVSEHELPDEAINLLLGYSDFAALVPAAALTAAETSGDRITLLVIDAIEAITALRTLPSIQMRAGQSESSGTNQFSRFRDVNWDDIRTELGLRIDRARGALDEGFDALGEDAFFFGTAPRSPDAVTGA